MLIYEMETNTVPFSGMSLLQVAQSLNDGQFPAPPEDAPLKALFFGACVVLESEKRASARELLDMVVQKLIRQCYLCLEEKCAPKGVECSGSTTHFICFECIPENMESILKNYDELYQNSSYVQV